MMTPTPRDTAWERLEAMIEAMPTGPARTQALVDMNALLTERNAFLRQDRAALAAQPEAADDGECPECRDAAQPEAAGEPQEGQPTTYTVKTIDCGLDDCGWRGVEHLHSGLGYAAAQPESREEPKP